MDTLDIRIETTPPMELADIKHLKKNKIINKFVIGEIDNHIVLSVPNHYFSNNAYIVRTEKELSMVLKHMEMIIINQGYKIDKIHTKRIDLPFTTIREEKETFESWQQVYKLFSLSSEKYGYITKYICGNDGLETIYFKDRPTKCRTQIIIYNQSKRLKDHCTIQEYDHTISSFRDLKQRTRTEVSFRKRTELDKLNLKESKEKAYQIIEHVFFNNLEQVIEETIKKLSYRLMEARKEENFRLLTFILKNQTFIYDFNILKEAIKNNYENKLTAKAVISKSKKILKGMEEEQKIFYIGNLKRIGEYLKQLKKEKRSPTSRTSNKIK